MEELFSVVIYLIFVVGVIRFLKNILVKNTSIKGTSGQSGAMPHKHEKGHYTSMPDVSKLPPGYILLNGEPVRVADLEGK